MNLIVMETALLLQSINKLGKLMTVGFGEAGKSVIGSALKDGYQLGQGAFLLKLYVCVLM
jgi:hypothetical protein